MQPEVSYDYAEPLTHSFGSDWTDNEQPSDSVTDSRIRCAALGVAARTPGQGAQMTEEGGA